MKLDIAICGQKDAGKGMIANGLLGHEVVKEGNPLRHEGETVTPHLWEDTERNFQVTVIDAHGFETVTDNTKAETNGQNVDLLLYMISVKEASPILVDKNILEKLKNVFNPSAWDHSIVVLTSANDIVNKSEDKHHSDIFFKKRSVARDYRETIEVWHRKIREAFRDVGLSCNVPIIAAGNKFKPLFDDEKYWLTDLYSAAKGQMIAEKKEVLDFINQNRFLDASKVTHGNFEEEIWRHPLVIAENPVVRNMKIKALIGALSAGGAAGLAGAGIGATIGALAIGLPTFGVAAGAGLVIGGAVGGAIGTAVGGAVGAGAAAHMAGNTEERH